MDMLYSRYSNPMDLMNKYINQGRFWEFVSGFLESESERKKQEFEKDKEMKLWIAYIHSRSEKTFLEWKNQVLEKGKDAKSGDENLDDEGIMSIMHNLFPDRPLLKNER